MYNKRVGNITILHNLYSIKKKALSNRITKEHLLGRGVIITTADHSQRALIKNIKSLGGKEIFSVFNANYPQRTKDKIRLFIFPLPEDNAKETKGAKKNPK